METFEVAQSVATNDTAQRLVNDVLVWIGFGTVVGLLAKGIMPGRDPGGAIATVLMGIGGTVMGCGLMSYLKNGTRVVPVSPMGMLVGVLGTLFILFFYKLLGGHYFIEGDYVTRTVRRRRSAGRQTRRRYDSAVYED
ncbi:MAG: GlsB/YeaQ/YmgE family stress response membrane protein [Planctomycetales bacterium]|nr:GlsB/YeaQ/YmgE family stress response membrane protein [Planctomycetales bacterium]